MKHCLAIDTKRIPYYGKDVIMTGSEAQEILYVLDRQSVWVERTQELEENTSYRQIIPYAIIRNTVDNRIALLERTKSQEEAKLHGYLYIGAGGHIEKVDANGKSLVEAGLKREVEEETGFTDYTKELIGVICVTDPGTPIVQRVHIGVVYGLKVGSLEFSGEVEKQNPTWINDEELVGCGDKLEPWSRLIVNRGLASF